MMTNEELKKAARLLAGSLPATDIIAQINAAAHEIRHEEEDAKAHRMKRFSLPDAEWQELRAYLLDGGGVPNSSCPSKRGKSLDQIMHDAIENDNQAVFWNEAFHWLKSHLIATGRVMRHSDGSTSSGPHEGVLHTPEPQPKVEVVKSK